MKVLAALGLVAGGGAAAAYWLQKSSPVLAIALGGSVLAGVGFAAVRARARRRDPRLLEPSFETSILAFPPEPKFERRTHPRT